MKLNDKQQKFVDEYLVDLNATQAAIRAGYSEKTARSQGQRLLTNVDIQERIAERRAVIQNSTEITQERVIKEIARLALFDPRKLLNEDGTPKPIQELDDDSAAAIAGIDLVSVGNSELGIGTVMKYKLADKNSALDKLCKHLGLYDADKSRKTEIHLTGFVIEAE